MWHPTTGPAEFPAGPVIGTKRLLEAFPTTVRYPGLGLAYSLSNAVFSGCAGLIITEVVKRTGDVGMPAYYAAATCAVSVPALLTLRGRSRSGARRRHSGPDSARDDQCAVRR